MSTSIEPYWYTIKVREESYFGDIDHFDGEDFRKLDSIKDGWDIKCSLVDLALIWTEFMAFKLDCLSCTVNLDYSEEFYNWIIEKEKEHEH